MRALVMAAMIGMAAGPAIAASTPHQDALVDSYFAIWDDDANVTAQNVAKLYAPDIDYYGHPMTRADLLRDKRAFIHRWPERRYTVEPGSASKQCNMTGDRCVIIATLNWRTVGPSGTHAGRSRVSLTLAQQDGGLKIVREGGVTLPR